MSITISCPAGKGLIAILFCIGVSVSSYQSKAQTISPDSIQLILDAHNVFRTEVGIPALTWSNDLAIYAQKWVNELVNNRDCGIEHRPYTEGDPWQQKFGENIYAGGGSDWTPTVLDAVASWGEEKAHYNLNTKTCKNEEVCGHYTQIIWKNTKQVGCAVARCANGNVIIVCNYDPSGNWGGEQPF